MNQPRTPELAAQSRCTLGKPRPPCPLYPRKRTSSEPSRYVRLVPKADIWQRSKFSLYSMTSSARASGIGGTSMPVVTTRTGAVRGVAERNVVAFKRIAHISDRTVEAGISAKAQ